jgi:hypothetical protein
MAAGETDRIEVRLSRAARRLVSRRRRVPVKVTGRLGEVRASKVIRLVAPKRARRGKTR